MNVLPIPMPRLAYCLRQGYSLSTLGNNLVARLGLVALPLAMALAIASGVADSV